MAHPFDRSLESFLRTRLAGPLPGKRAHRNYAHAQSYGRHHGPPRLNSRRAAVMILMRWDGQQWLVTLTKRPAGGVHSRQICFPGGGIERGETVTQAAIRECQEETGWAPKPAEVLGQLSPIYVYGSDNYVSCLVAMTDSEPTWNPDDREVAELLEAPLEHLCTDRQLHETVIERRGMLTRAPCFRWQSYDIWGATSMMLSELKSIIVP